jgi:subtilisin family serine protease
MLSIRNAFRGVTVLVIICAMLGAGDSTRGAVAAPPDTVRLFITVPGPASPSDIAAIQAAGGEVRHAFATSNTISVEVPTTAVSALSANPRFTNIRPVPETSAVEDQLVWGIDRIEADKVWGGVQGAVNVSPTGNAGDGIKVGIIDTGIDKTHPDLQANLNGGINFVDKTCKKFSILGTCTRTGRLGPSNWDDDNGHGSHVAGIVGAVDNGSGVIGVAPRVSLFGIKALDYAGSGYLDDAIAGLEWASGLNGGTKVQIVNMSFGCDCDDPALHAAVDSAYAAGVLLVGAAGNVGPGTDTVAYPAHYDSVIAVGATCGPVFSFYCSGAIDSLPVFSSTGPSVELAAPGDSIYSTWKDNGYQTESGTSMASPHVAGAAALVLAANPGWTNAQVRQRLIDTAVDLGAPGRDESFGYGLINAFAASFNGSNHAPVAEDGTATTNEDTSVNVVLTASDADGDALTFNIVTPPAHGTLTGSGSSRTYKPAANYNGADSFTFNAYDGIDPSNVATVAITINPVNDPPKAVNDSAQTAQDTSTVINVLANDSDPDGDTVSLVSAGPSSTKGGTVAANPDGTVTYTPPSGFNGVDSFTYKISDGNGLTDTATVSVAVGSANTLHVVDLDASTSTLLYLWRGLVTVVVRDQNGMAVANAYVYGGFSNGLSGSGACITDSTGVCVFGSNWASSGTTGTFTVTNITLSGYVYAPSANTDPDGDSDGTTITITLQ